MNDRKIDVISIGDCVIDCLFYVNRQPKCGETMAANNFECLPGGKGANACIASARLGSNNAFICKLGSDLFGNNLIETLKKENINIEHVTFTNTSPTSVASILVDNNGNNYIAVNFGATLELNEKDIDNAENLIKDAKVLVTSMVVRDKTALHALKLGKKNNCITVFNFAPANKDLGTEFNEYVDVLVVNEVEAEVFTGETVKNVEDAVKACKVVLSREGFHIGVVVTLGENGAVFGDKRTGETKHFPANKVKAVDTTGAGDAFVGSLSHYISKLGTNSMHRAIELAGKYASISVLSKGTQASYPHLKDLDNEFKI